MRDESLTPAPPPIGQWLNWSVQIAEDATEFGNLVSATAKEYPHVPAWLSDPEFSRRETDREVRTFFRLAGIYDDAFNGRPVESKDVLARYRGAMGATEHTLAWLVPLEGVEFSQDHLDCGAFEIRRFSSEELDGLLRNSARKLFFEYAYIDSAQLAPYWFVYVTKSARLQDWDEIVFDAKVRVRFSDFPSQVEAALRILALFDWQGYAKFWSPTPMAKLADGRKGSEKHVEGAWDAPFYPGLPFVVKLSDSLTTSPERGPDLSLLQSEPYYDPDTGEDRGEQPARWIVLNDLETREFEGMMRRGGSLVLTLAPYREQWAFIEVAMGFLLKALGTTGLEQLLWNMAAIEATVGEDQRSLTKLLATRTRRILGHADVYQAFQELYKFRSRLVHGNQGLVDEEVYLGHLRQARDFARSVVCWMLNYLGHVASVVGPSPPVGVPSRADLLMALDMVRKPEMISLLRGLPNEFPCLQDWLTL
jgi:hypothetical protein